MSCRHGIVNAAGSLRGPVPGRTGRRRGTASLALGLGAALALTGCASGPEGGAAPAATTALAPATATASITAIPAPAPDGPTGNTTPAQTADGSPTVADPSGDSRAFTTTSGVFTWTLPPTWTVTVTQLDDSAEQVDYVGVPYEVVTFQNDEGTVGFEAFTGIGPTANEGVRHDVLEVIDTQGLSDLPIAEDGSAQGPVWYRAAVLRPNEGSAAATDPPEPVEPGEAIVRIDVANVPEGVDVEDTAYRAYWSGFFYTVDHPNPAGEPRNSATLITGEIRQSRAEELTGLHGGDAARAVLDTDEYAELREVMTSLRVASEEGDMP
jgi:hypothetical protein